jgi:hypothetical protein
MTLYTIPSASNHLKNKDAACHIQRTQKAHLLRVGTVSLKSLSYRRNRPKYTWKEIMLRELIKQVVAIERCMHHRRPRTKYIHVYENCLQSIHAT